MTSENDDFEQQMRGLYDACSACSIEIRITACWKQRAGPYQYEEMRSSVPRCIVDVLDYLG